MAHKTGAAYSEWSHHPRLRKRYVPGKSSGRSRQRRKDSLCIHYKEILHLEGNTEDELVAALVEDSRHQRRS